MARIRKIEIRNFRNIATLDWCPSDGVNCLIGAGDSGKSTLLDAIDLCLGARRAIQFTDADFNSLNSDNPISVTVTLGELDDDLKNIENYGLFLRGFNTEAGEIEDEPENALEPVLSLNLLVENDLEPTWSLVSDRAADQDAVRNLSWSDRQAIAPARIGALISNELGWRKGSLLTRLSEEKADTSAALARVAREAREAFGTEAEEQLGETLDIVMEASKELGIDVGDKVRALLDANSVSFSSGTISLHDERGVPLKGLGLGSTRLLIAGLQRRVAGSSRILLIDELEHGLEPHRLMRFLDSLGAKEEEPPLQAILTTHSPVALRELSGNQLVVLRETEERHLAVSVGTEDAIQSTIRLYPEAFLASSVIVCEGASEVGFLRGLDQYRNSVGHTSMFASGVALVDSGGGSPDRPFERASAFLRLGYRVAVLRDDDVAPTEGVEEDFVRAGGSAFAWFDGCAIEDDIFASVSASTIERLIDYAVELHGPELIDAHIKSVTKSKMGLDLVRNLIEIGTTDDDLRAMLGEASRRKRSGWFKSVSWMEEVGRNIVGPALRRSDADFIKQVDDIFAWTLDG